ncbi:MAG TPA: S4 domain-containing protein [Burkholderiaceae bacterium]|nr:S4 domain-containing protein [Burkholderiaceae bacterium]
MRSTPRPAEPSGDKVRLDKWLWAARFFKTRSLSADEIGRGRVQVNGQVAKASREVRVGDTIALKQGVVALTVVVTAASDHRGPATQAQGLFAETAESIEQRTAQAQARRENTEPALVIAQGRPTKRDRRELADWNRWSASIEPE